MVKRDCITEALGLLIKYLLGGLTQTNNSSYGLKTGTLFCRLLCARERLSHWGSDACLSPDISQLLGWHCTEHKVWENGSVTMKNAVFWDVTPCGSCENRRFGGTYCLRHQGDFVFLRSVRQLLFTATFLVHRFLPHG
jgi:hypothetical protein